MCKFDDLRKIKGHYEMRLIKKLGTILHQSLYLWYLQLLPSSNEVIASAFDSGLS